MPTAVVQLDLLPLPPRPNRGKPLVACRIAGQPVRAKHACTCFNNHPSTRPIENWAEWRAAAVGGLSLWWDGRPTIAVPVIAQVTAVFERPREPRTTYTLKGVERPYPFAWTSGRVQFVGRPDWDQVGKAAVDVLVHAGILLDDPLVTDGGTPRWYAAEGEGPCVEVRLWHA